MTTTPDTHIAAAIHVAREKDREGWGWTLTTEASITDEQAAAITWRATPDQVVLGEFVKVEDAGGYRIGHLSRAEYVEHTFAPAYVLCSLELR